MSRHDGKPRSLPAPLALDPLPWHCPGADDQYRIAHGRQLECDTFVPRAGYSQNPEDYA